MHQTSKITLNSARREINSLLKSNICHNGNIINNLEKRGNTASTAHFVAIADQIRNERIQSGDKVIFSISASGLTTGTALYVFDDLPDRLQQPRARQSIETKTPVNHRPYPSSNGHLPGIRIESVGTLPEEGGDTMELLRKAAGNCLDRSAYEGGEIGLLIYTGVYRSDYLLEPAYAALLAGQLDMNATMIGPDAPKTLAFDIFNGAIGFLNACHAAQQTIATGQCETAMVVTAECENNAVDNPNQLVGIRETASAMVLDRHPSPGKGFSRFLFRYQTTGLEQYSTYINPSESKPYLHIEKDEQLEWRYLDSIGPVVEELLQKEGLALEQIDLVFPPQISTNFIEQLGATLGLPSEKLVDAVAGGADYFTSALPYALEDAQEKGRVSNGDVGLVIAVGSGIQVGCAIYYF